MGTGTEIGTGNPTRKRNLIRNQTGNGTGTKNWDQELGPRTGAESGTGNQTGI